MSYFSPSITALQELHREKFAGTELDFAAGIFRTIPLMGGDTNFALAYQVPKLMEELFARERTTR